MWANGAFVIVGVWLHFIDRKSSSSRAISTYVSIVTLLVSLFVREVGNSLSAQESILPLLEFLIILGYSQDLCVFSTVG